MAFLTIMPSAGLTPAQRREAARCGPPVVLARRDYPVMLEEAGFSDVVTTDVTPSYLSSARSWLDESSAREDALRTALGDAVFDDRQRDRRLQIAAIERGLLRRALFVARAG